MMANQVIRPVTHFWRSENPQVEQVTDCAEQKLNWKYVAKKEGVKVGRRQMKRPVGEASERGLEGGDGDTATERHR